MNKFLEMFTRLTRDILRLRGVSSWDEAILVILGVLFNGFLNFINFYRDPHRSPISPDNSYLCTQLYNNL